MKEFKLERGERIIGVHGYLDQNEDLRGFGFIVLKRNSAEWYFLEKYLQI